MWIKQLNLIGFGKFKNKTIDLHQGINILYGENEAGKSTLHSFIDGMFFGFLRPNVTSALYRMEYDKYNPWDKGRYAGVIRFYHQGKPYRIERDFAKDKPNTRVLDETTGVDITNDIDCGNVKVLQPGIHFFDFNTRIFSNTISIKQIGSKTDSELANEVTEKLINISTALDDNISVDKAIAELKDLKQEIGTEKAPTKPYAKNIKEIEDLHEEKKNILLEKNSHDLALEEKTRLTDLLELEMKDLDDLKKNLSIAETLEKKNILKEAEEINRNIQNLEENTEKLQEFSNLSKDEYKEAVDLNQDLGLINRDIGNDERELLNINNTLEEYNNSPKDDSSKDKTNDMSTDFNNYEELEEKKNKILMNKKDNSLNFLERDIKTLSSKVQTYKTTQIASLILLLPIILVMIFKQLFILAVLLPLPMIIAGYLASKSKKAKMHINNIQKQIDNINRSEEIENQEIQDIDKTQLSILEKYNIKTKIEFNRLYEDNRIQTLSLAANIKAQNDLQTKKNALTTRIKDNTIDKEDKSIKINEILSKNNLNSLEEFNQGLDNKVDYDKYIEELKSSKTLLNKILGENTIESLTEEVNGITIDHELEGLDKNQINEDIKNKNLATSSIREDLREAKVNVEQYGKNLYRLIEIDEEIARKTNYKIELDEQINSIDLAINTIEELSKDIHSEFAPAINKTLSEIVEKITSGKYNSVKVSESLDISIENPTTREIVKIDSLSGGTIDQLYFALRFGIINSMISKNLPLILDDCFAQYDNKRLINTLDFLKNDYGERQIIFFTCQNREIELLKSLGVNYNLINLT